MAIKNPRYPHHVRIYRREEDGFTGAYADTDLYEGKCRKEPNRTGGYAERVIKGDFRMSVPDTSIDVKSGDLMDITDKGGYMREVTVNDAYIGNIGVTIWFNLTKN